MMNIEVISGVAYVHIVEAICQVGFDISKSVNHNCDR
jgi:hypothetical protein